jgi:hypothetical protein
VCDEYGIDGNGEFSGGNDSYLNRINVFCHTRGQKLGQRPLQNG